ncbi:hypothetical protein [Pseudoalteromonas byunsanensis]|uniref:DUF4157 domain-containing protein n=1 Tax=Pseudoalteromonas byunsanensis TaxID=327939 RepID=A0A1S1N573_9GAMM|nr:hypothetical protein [Pseudoalteromonas byunsanensis]OHU93413.1 hypothetical protein BIW53_18805 [Pseudoalteromonas byunsanensis]
MKNLITPLLLALSMSTSVNATQLDVTEFLKVLPQYVQWAVQVDKEGQKTGTPLNKVQLQIAKEVGVTHPEKIRMVYVDSVPYPYENPVLKEMGERIGFIGEGITNNAQVFGYSIYVRKGFTLDTPKLAHEFVHVKQIEQASSLLEYSKKHLVDMATYGYADAPYEKEAFKANEKYKQM